jgi:phosphate:Na+ symporter
MAAFYLKNKIFLCLVAFFLVLSSAPLFAAEKTPNEISFVFIAIGLLGGLAFFLYGIEKMSQGMKKTAGDKMRSLLAALTKNRVVALFTGAFVTMVIQSSSATTVMLVSFVQAELMSFVQSLGVILGADIGTTITAQLIAFKLTDYALVMVAFGVGIRMFSKNENTRNIGDIVLGCGILFFGMKMMSDAMHPLRTYDEFINIMKGLENPVAGLLVGTIFTALIQSSSAFTGIVIVLAQQGLISLDAGIPLIFGGNIGTCVTAGLASIGASREAKRVALAHTIFKIAGVMLFIFWIPQFADIITAIAIKFGSDAGRQIANAHTIFNVSLGLVFLPFTTLFAALVFKILPKIKDDNAIKLSTWHLKKSFLDTPALAINLVRMETSRMAKLLERMMRAIIVPFISDEKWINKGDLEKSEAELLLREVPKQDEIFPHLTLMEGVDMREEKLDYIDEKIGNYLMKIAGNELTESQTGEVYGMMSIVSDMESIGDIIHRNMVPLVEKKQRLEMDFSSDGKEELMIYHGKVCRQIRLLNEAFAETDPIKARKIMKEERVFLDLELKYRVQHLERMLHKKKESVETHEVHMELMDLMKQIAVYTSNIAKIFFETCAENKYKISRRGGVL